MSAKVLVIRVKRYDAEFLRSQQTFASQQSFQPHVMKPEGSLPFLMYNARYRVHKTTCPYPEPDQPT
jgi:hypothetical protein